MAVLPEISIEQRRQLLVDRQLLGGDGRGQRDVDGVVAALGLLHSTDPATPHLSIHARSDVSISDVDAAIYDEPARLLRHTTIRRTVFLMPSDVVPLAHGAYNPPLVGRLRSQLLKWLEAGDSLTGSAETFLEQTERSVVE